jgi:5-methylcytosine-specific restriction endonuclease McrA
MRHDADGVLDVGRKTRTIPLSIRRALTARDAGCRFPGCTSRRCDAHHLTHWADGGATSVDNLVLLCRRHHRAVHEGGG